MSPLPAAIRTAVVERADFCCEYCLVHEMYAPFIHEVDHVIARKHGGEDVLENLAYACAQCNRFKGSDIASIDPATGLLVTLFNPRTQNLHEHFRLDGFVIDPLTAIGRATVRLRQLNQIDRLLLRQELHSQNRYP